MRNQKQNIRKCGYIVLRCLPPSKHGHLRLPLCAKRVSKHGRPTTFLLADDFTRRWAQITPIVLNTIGAVKIKLFSSENKYRLNPSHVALSLNLPRVFVVLFKRKGALHFRVHKPFYTIYDAADGARRAPEHKLVERLDGREVSCDAARTRCRTTRLVKYVFAAYYWLRKAAVHKILGLLRNVSDGVSGLTQSSNTSSLFVLRLLSSSRNCRVPKPHTKHCTIVLCVKCFLDFVSRGVVFF